MADYNSALGTVMQTPGLQELVNNSITRQRELAPVRTALGQQAVNMLPNAAFNRPNIGAIPRADYSTPPIAGNNGGGMDWVKILSLLGAGAAGGSLISKLLDAIKNKNSGGNTGGGPGGGSSGGGGGNLYDAIARLFGRGGGPGNYPISNGPVPPGREFGGPGTTTFGSNPDYDPFGWNDGFTGPINDPYGILNGPEPTPGLTGNEDFLGGGGGAGTGGGSNGGYDDYGQDE